jgi:hypothetical protein
MASVRHLSKKARYDIGNRYEDEEPERRERAEERDSCSQRVDNERDGVLNDVERASLPSASRPAGGIGKRRIPC